MQEIVNTMNGYIWSPYLIYLCLGTGVFFSILTRFVQVRQFREMFRLLLSGKSSDKGISSFQALAAKETKLVNLEEVIIALPFIRKNPSCLVYK